MKRIATLIAGAALLAAGITMANDTPPPTTDIAKEPAAPNGTMPQQNGETLQVPTLDVLDKDHDGFISSTEATGSKDIASVFTQADADKNGKLDRMEYAQAVKLIQG